MARLTINDHPVQIDMDPQTPLLFALRDGANLTGTKYGCGVGDCGACTVMVDGAALRSCLITLSECEGRFVTTIEGLSADRSHPVQQAMVAEQAIQCGFCTPGIVMTAAALLKTNPDPSEAQILDAVPNLCRCGVYPRLVRAIQRAGRVARRLETISAAPAPGITPADAARAVPALRTLTKSQTSGNIP
ncbi:(2Fe-2S)-binding protein [Novosphingobium sp. 9]|uniref:(2Fe-2S)-binding protein n=1 Tax=Novosphingobium sp. 9 TaxID=2025349 RepID=UPI0021B54F1D|nr:(2Fe-2S)-binding protein [Novosphingobium sp. 9]